MPEKLSNYKANSGQTSSFQSNLSYNQALQARQDNNALQEQQDMAQREVDRIASQAANLGYGAGVALNKAIEAVNSAMQNLQVTISAIGDHLPNDPLRFPGAEAASPKTAQEVEINFYDFLDETFNQKVDSGEIRIESDAPMPKKQKTRLMNSLKKSFIEAAKTGEANEIAYAIRYSNIVLVDHKYSKNHLATFPPKASQTSSYHHTKNELTLICDFENATINPEIINHEIGHFYDSFTRTFLSRYYQEKCIAALEKFSKSAYECIFSFSEGCKKIAKTAQYYKDKFVPRYNPGSFTKDTDHTKPLSFYNQAGTEGFLLHGEIRSVGGGYTRNQPTAVQDKKEEYAESATQDQINFANAHDVIDTYLGENFRPYTVAKDPKAQKKLLKEAAKIKTDEDAEMHLSRLNLNQIEDERTMFIKENERDLEAKAYIRQSAPKEVREELCGEEITEEPNLLHSIHVETAFNPPIASQSAKARVSRTLDYLPDDGEYLTFVDDSQRYSLTAPRKSPENPSTTKPKKNPGRDQSGDL